LSDFINSACGIFFDCLCQLTDEGLPIDSHLLYDFVVKKHPDWFRIHQGDLEVIIAETITSMPTGHYAEHYARVVLGYSIASRVDQYYDEMRDAPASDHRRIRDKIDEEENRLNRSLDTGKSPSDVVGQWAESMATIKHGGSIPTPMASLDERIGGPIPRGSYVLIGALPSTGKTLFMLQMIKNCAAAGNHCVMFSQEMSYEQLGERLANMILPIYDPSKITAENVEELKQLARDIFTSDRIMFRRVKPSSDAIVEEMSYCVRRYGTTVFAVDYLQMLQGGRSTYDQRTYDSARIKSACVEYGVTTLMASQLSRIQDKPPIPQLNHFRDSGQIEADGDCIFMLRHPIKDTDEEKVAVGRDIDPKEYYQIYVRKIRNRVATGLFECRLCTHPLRLAPLLDHREEF
jgi:replicative DNA helicase